MCGCGSAEFSCSVAMPTSDSWANPSSATRMLAGLKSRCICRFTVCRYWSPLRACASTAASAASGTQESPRSWCRAARVPNRQVSCVVLRRNKSTHLVDRAGGHPVEREVHAVLGVKGGMYARQVVRIAPRKPCRGVREKEAVQAVEDTRPTGPHLLLGQLLYEGGSF